MKSQDFFCSKPFLAIISLVKSFISYKAGSVFSFMVDSISINVATIAISSLSDFILLPLVEGLSVSESGG